MRAQANQRLSDRYRAGFKKAAVTAVECALRDFNMQGEKEEFILFLLGDEEDSPFVWRVWDEQTSVRFIESSLFLQVTYLINIS